MKTLLIIRGLPGSGKTTLAETIVGKDSVYSADDYFTDMNGNYNYIPSQIRDAHEFCFNNVKQRMLYSDVNGESPVIAVANTFTQEWEMEKFFNLAKEFGYTVHSIVVENRHGNKNVHDVSDYKVAEMRTRFEVKL